LQTFYILVFVAGLLVAQLLLQILKAAGSLGSRPPVQRKMPFLSAEEQLCLAAIEEAVGPNYRVLAKVALAHVLMPDQDARRRQRARAALLLRDLVADFLVCAAADGHPLCAVSAKSEPMSRAARREVAEMESACTEAGLPVVTLALRDRYELAEMRGQLLDAIETADVRVAVAPEPQAADEEALLAALAASMQQPDGLGGRHVRARR
jgi:hypothetical protein